jgi:hypothetical protein
VTSVLHVASPSEHRHISPDIARPRFIQEQLANLQATGVELCLGRLASRARACFLGPLTGDATQGELHAPAGGGRPPSGTAASARPPPWAQRPTRPRHESRGRPSSCTSPSFRSCQGRTPCMSSPSMSTIRCGSLLVPLVSG